MIWDRINQGVVVVTSSTPTIQGVSNPDEAALNAEHWYRRLTDDSSIPAGHYATGWQWRGLEGNRSVYEPSGTLEIVEPEPYPNPQVVIPTVDTNGNVVGTCRLLADAATGELVVVVDSASPQRSWAVQFAEFIARKDGVVSGWANCTKAEKILIIGMYKLAKLHYPTLTPAQYIGWLRSIASEDVATWDAALGD